MKVILTDKAEERLNDIFEYYQQQTDSAKTAKKIIADIIQSMQMLKKFPQMAAIEPALADCSKTFRSFVVRSLFKIIYYINEEKSNIVVVTVWDCRQNPDNLKNEVEEIQPII